MKPYKVLIVDDEPLARENLHFLCKKDRELDLLTPSGNGREAIEAIKCNKPDIIFLDIQMPGINGFQVLEALPGTELPCIVFVTAFNEFAVKAFELQAIDYLLKPFDDDRFNTALNRAKKARQGDRIVEMDQKLRELLNWLNEKGPSIHLGQADTQLYLERIPLKSGSEIHFVESNEILGITADGDYATIETVNGDRFYIRETMANFESKLNPEQFIRIHRSHIIKISNIEKVVHLPKGGMQVVTHQGKKIKAGIRYFPRLRQLLDK